jgi:Tfp pilus assembly protein PilF
MDSFHQADRSFAEGVRHQAAGATRLAHASFRQAIALWPSCAAAWANLGLLHDDAGEWALAARCYGQALALDPGLYEAALNLGALQARLKRYPEAEVSCHRASALRPEAAAPWTNLGAMLTCLRRDADALACLLHALELERGNDRARFNLSYLLLRQGRWAEGLLCLESRPGLAELQAAVDGPRWDGAELAGRSLLVVSDAGLGDMIQMARYAPLLRARGAARLVLQCPSALKRLLARDAGFDLVLGGDEPLPRTGWDLWTPALSLPYLCQTRPESMPDRLPYLAADPDRVAHWRARRAPGTPLPGALRVGLVWRGNPRHENDADRSLPALAALAPLAAVPGVVFVSLQCGAGADEAGTPPPGLRLQRLPEPWGDFAETAAIVAGLDLVIGVDTSTVHLAAALGTPTWVLLPDHKTDWRWLEGRSDSPWYPGLMRLFRQPVPGDWAPVVAAVTTALCAWQARAGARLAA